MWVRFHDSTPDDPDLDRLSDGAFRVYFASICYSQRNQTDGVITANQAARSVPKCRPAYLKELTANPFDHEDGPLFRESSSGVYVIRNFAKYQGTSQGWAAKKQADAERQAEWRRKREEG